MEKEENGINREFREETGPKALKRQNSAKLVEFAKDVGAKTMKKTEDVGTALGRKSEIISKRLAEQKTVKQFGKIMDEKTKKTVNFIGKKVKSLGKSIKKTPYNTKGPTDVLGPETKSRRFEL